jgi:hypothetical protein
VRAKLVAGEFTSVVPKVKDTYIMLFGRRVAHQETAIDVDADDNQEAQNNDVCL